MKGMESMDRSRVIINRLDLLNSKILIGLPLTDNLSLVITVPIVLRLLRKSIP